MLAVSGWFTDVEAQSRSRGDQIRRSATVLEQQRGGLGGGRERSRILGFVGSDLFSSLRDLSLMVANGGGFELGQSEVAVRVQGVLMRRSSPFPVKGVSEYPFLGGACRGGVLLCDSGLSSGGLA
ncbi:Uncharacterized protein Rs2_05934 [Raphanus sativus]|nr:Uncharacterized protein Rs2_05934 [Raphanus sativus]